MVVTRCSLVVGGLLGFVAGAAVGMLYAPASGERTRRVLQRRGKRIGIKAHRVAENAGQILERSRHLLA